VCDESWAEVLTVTLSKLVGVHAPQKHPSLVNLNEGELVAIISVTSQLMFRPDPLMSEVGLVGSYWARKCSRLMSAVSRLPTKTR
jgi:hypothetical protein